jgi:hypothetical protein
MEPGREAKRFAHRLNSFVDPSLINPHERSDDMLVDAVA